MDVADGFAVFALVVVGVLAAVGVVVLVAAVVVGSEEGDGPRDRGC